MNEAGLSERKEARALQIGPHHARDIAPLGARQEIRNRDGNGLGHALIDAHLQRRLGRQR